MIPQRNVANRCNRGVPKGGKGRTMPWAPESLNVASTSFNTVHLLPKDLRFEHGGAT